MDLNNGIDMKPKGRGRPRRRLTLDRTGGVLSNETADDTLEDTDVEQVLNVRVKERDAEAGRKGRLGSIFKDTPSTAIKVLFNKEQTAHEVKDTIRRPLSGLFRRPGSRGAFASAPEKESKPEVSTGNVETIATNYQKAERPMTPEISSLDRRLLNKNVANAPGMGVNRVAAIYQLDALNAKNAFLSKLDDIDISQLSRYLCTEDEVRDEKVVWSWDYVFASITSEMREEWAFDDDETLDDTRK